MALIGTQLNQKNNMKMGGVGMLRIFLVAFTRILLLIKEFFL
jgi:hypothetical protein